jgi:tetratricopeptide (TPR) repeat protein
MRTSPKSISVFRWVLLSVAALLLLIAVLTTPLHNSLAQDSGTPTFAPTAAVCTPIDGTPTYFIGLGDAFLARNNQARAITAYTCALERDASYAPAYIKRGLAYAAQRNDPLALADYDTALELDPNSVDGYNSRGVLYTLQGNFGLALGDFNVALALDPQNVVALNNRGIVHAAEGNYDLALADLQAALALDPEFALPHASLGAVYLAMAAQSYEQYNTLTGGRALPNGDAGRMLEAIQFNRTTGNFAHWLAFQTGA